MNLAKPITCLLLCVGCERTSTDPIELPPQPIKPDSAKVSFSFVPSLASGLPYHAAIVSYDDGDGMKTIRFNGQTGEFITRNTGTLRVRFIVSAPDTLVIGEVDLPLKKDWRWSVSGYVTNRNPQLDGFCLMGPKTFALRRPLPGADSMYILWAGAPNSHTVLC
jgi:hypothetical protein